jgi:DNA-binding NtrC family response regulator
MADLLQAEGISSATCADSAECTSQLAAGAGALLLAEEALEMPHALELLDAVKAQPPWSELPLIILTTGGESHLVRI